MYTLPMATPAPLPAPAPFAASRFLARRKVFSFLGAKFHLYDESGALIAFVRQKAFKLKEDIRVYTDEQASRELLLIRARQVIDFAAAYDVVDPATGQKIGALKRKGWKSILIDEWLVLDATDREIGSIKEDSALMAMLRRFLSNLIPQTFQVTIGGAKVGEIKQAFNPFVLKHRVDFGADVEGRLDRRLGLAAVILLLAIEGRQG